MDYLAPEKRDLIKAAEYAETSTYPIRVLAKKYQDIRAMYGYSLTLPALAVFTGLSLHEVLEMYICDFIGEKTLEDLKSELSSTETQIELNDIDYDLSEETNDLENRRSNLVSAIRYLETGEISY